MGKYGAYFKCTGFAYKNDEQYYIAIVITCLQAHLQELMMNMTEDTCTQCYSNNASEYYTGSSTRTNDEHDRGHMYPVLQ